MAGSILFLTDSEEATDRFIHDYVLDLIDRVPDIEGCEGVSFDQDAQMNPDGDSVVLVVVGDIETLVDCEQERWEAHQESGVINQWETKPLSDEQLAWKFGEGGTELAKRLMPLGAKMSKLAYEEFKDEPLPEAVDAHPEDDGWMSVGWWAVPHHLTVGNLGYSPSDEIEMCLAAIEEDLRITAERQGPDATDTMIDEVIDTLEEMREDVKDGRPKPEASATD